jgi:RimJ/RimL family protein N-acetyltransferase
MNSAVLKDGRKITLRDYGPADKEALVAMYAALSPETVRWGLPPYDRAKVERLTSNLEYKINLIALSDSRIVGHLQIYTVPMQQMKGVGELLIYLHQDFHNLGLGTAMMREAIREARARGWHRVRLTVVAENHRAIRSYEKVGFEREGLSRDNYFGEDGKYHDEVQMGLLIGPAEEGESSQ